MVFIARSSVLASNQRVVAILLIILFSSNSAEIVITSRDASQFPGVNKTLLSYISQLSFPFRDFYSTFVYIHLQLSLISHILIFIFFRRFI